MKRGTGLYPLAWDSGWKNPCLLEHLLSDDRKVKSVFMVLSNLQMKITQYTDHKWFDIENQ